MKKAGSEVVIAKLVIFVKARSNSYTLDDASF